MDSQSPDVRYFASIPWCAARMAAGPDVICETPPSRIAKKSGEDTLFAVTLNTEDTIKAFICMYHLPSPPPAVPATVPPLKENSPLIVDKATFLISLGEGVAGYPGACHGGVAMSILDEVIGMILPINIKHGIIREGAIIMTAYLNTSFRRPIKVPGDYFCRGWLEKTEGRKFFLKGTIEDQHGEVLASADCLYVALKEKL